MTNVVYLQKIQERRVTFPVRPEWPERESWRETPHTNALLILVPLLGFALAAMLMLSFTIAVQGMPVSYLHGATSGSSKPVRIAECVL